MFASAELIENKKTRVPWSEFSIFLTKAIGVPKMYGNSTLSPKNFYGTTKGAQELPKDAKMMPYNPQDTFHSYIEEHFVFFKNTSLLRERARTAQTVPPGMFCLIDLLFSEART